MNYGKLDYKVKPSTLNKLNSINTNTLRSQIDRAFIHIAGKTHKSYSHDLRHRFAIELYLENRDIYEVSKKLFHSNISVTTAYLQGLGILS